MLPYILLADDDNGLCCSFTEQLDKQIAYADIKTVGDGRSFLTFLNGRTWKDLPSIILVNYDLPDAKAPDLLRELLMEDRYREIPKLVWSRTGQAKEKEECQLLGVRNYLQLPCGASELESIVRQIDQLLKAELSIV